MLRLTASLFITSLLFLFTPQSGANLRRITNTSEHAISLNPTLSDDGKVVVFESSADLTGARENSSFRAIRADLATEGLAFKAIGNSRVVSPALSSDGRIIVFASMEDLVGRNVDRNSEIFSFDGAELKQLTDTGPSAGMSRLSDGNFQPSVTSDGRMIAFSSNRNLCGLNSDLSYEIFLYDSLSRTFTQLTNALNEQSSGSPKISGDGSRVYYKRTALSNPNAGDVMLVDVQTATTRMVATDIADLALSEGRAVSNDGMRLVYSAATAPNQTQVFVYEGRGNSIRQVTQLGSRSVDVNLQPTISGDGKRIAFATRRRVTNASDGGVELYLLDLPTGQVRQITNAPSSATAEVVSSLNFDGSLVVFNFARIISGPVSDDDLRNNSEIYLSSIEARPEFGAATVRNAASLGREPGETTRIAPGSIATIRGSAIALRTETVKTGPALVLAGTTVKVNGHPARMLYATTDEVLFVVPNGLLNGPAEFVVTNSEGFSSKAVANLSAAAPGVFTVKGDGSGEGIILASDTLIATPFNPSNGQLRLSIFATGVAQAQNLLVTIKAKPVKVETVAASSLLGLDEIHVLVPAELAGAGTCTLIVTADGVQSNPVSVFLLGTAPTPTPTPTPTSTPSITPTPTPLPSPTPTPNPSPTPSPDASPTIVISQIFGGGGNSGAPFRNDFIEIFNNGNSPVNLGGWSVQYASATASTWSVTPLTSVVLLPGQYYLIQESSGGSNGATLPAPDATGTIAMAAASGKVALVENSTALTGTCPNDPNILDLVGYGSTANCFRGSAPAPPGSNTNAVMRAANGCTDTRNNVADFSPAAPVPKNSMSPAKVCSQAVAVIFIHLLRRIGYS